MKVEIKILELTREKRRISLEQLAESTPHTIGQD